MTKLLLDLAAVCAVCSDEHLVNLPCKRLQVDEIWAFCYAKAKNVPVEMKGTFGYGDVWTFAAIAAGRGARHCCLATNRVASAGGGAMAAPCRLVDEVRMSSLKRASVAAGLALAAALVFPPAVQAAGRALPLGPGTWLEAGLTLLAGWWERTLSPVRPSAPRNGGEEIGSHIDPNGATTPAPPPSGRTCGECSEIGSGIDPDG